MKLTIRAIETLAYAGDGKSRDVRWDDALPGFGVRVYPTGEKSFVLSYRHRGRKRLITIGKVGVHTLSKARTNAKRHLVEVADGVDPLEARRLGDNVAALCKAYITQNVPRKRSGGDDKRRIERHILPAWKTRECAGITRQDVATLHRKIGESAPYEANRVVALVSKLYEFARTEGLVTEGHPNPARGISKFSEVKRDRWVKPAELPRLAEAIDAEENVFVRAALWLYLLTGMRKTELLSARWEHLDIDRAELRLPDTKQGRVHIVPLSAPAMALLREIPRLAGNPHILPGKRPRRSLVNISKPWYRVRDRATVMLWSDQSAEAAQVIAALTEKLGRAPTAEEVTSTCDFELPTGLKDVRLHDLRRTVGSWLATSGNSLPLIGKVLGHSNASTTQIYARLGEDTARAALESHAQQIMGVAGKRKPAEVVPLKQAK